MTIDELHSGAGRPGDDDEPVGPVVGPSTRLGTADAAPPETPAEPFDVGTGDDEELEVPARATDVLRRGLAASPELRRGLLATALLGLTVAVGRLTVPVIIQQALDRPARADGSPDAPFVVATAAIALTVILISAVLGWYTQRRLVVRAEEAIANLRTRAFDHIHRLSVADHNETKRGVLVARVTSDAEALARFAQWGLFSWTVNPALILGIAGVMAIYSWQLTLVVLAAYLPVVPLMAWIQKRQLTAYDNLRTRVAEMLSAFSEAVMGAAVIRAYGAQGRTGAGLEEAIGRRYRARMVANRYMAMVFVVGDLFGAVALASALAVGLWQREAWGLEAGSLVACLFLTTMLNGPIADLAETMDQTQTATAGWRKILDLLDRPIDVVEPVDGHHLDAGPIGFEAIGVGFAYRDGDPVLHEVSIDIPPGTKVAVVGATGSGKTTFAKLLCRLADPVSGRIELNGVDLRTVDPESRHRSVRMVPQDGFLFDDTVAANVLAGRVQNGGRATGHSAVGPVVAAAPAAGDDEAQVRAAFAALGLGWWVDRLPNGLDSPVGERGENLSVGERQLVALARAQLADPGLLVLDEATSAVDPETDQALTTALRRLAEGRTLLSVAHRLSTAEAADLVLVFEAGRLVERGHHDELVACGGIYAGLHQAWIGNTRAGGGGQAA
ncbi:MAG: ABC transporter ATP-binding protein [Actinomycetota bacterium]